MTLKPRQQQVLAAMRAGTLLYHDRKFGGCYLQRARGQAVEPVAPFTVKQLIAGRYIKKDPPVEGEPAWLDCYRSALKL